ncbi:hypothetical protein Hanom_Chr11g01057031 [Helianthus anomalus]
MTRPDPTRTDPIRTNFFTYIPWVLKFLKMFHTPMKKFLGQSLNIRNNLHPSS